MRLDVVRLAVATLISLALPAGASGQDAAPATAWSPQPWIEDLEQMRTALVTGYANREWLEEDRELPLDASFARIAARLRTARSDAEARAIFERIITRIHDGHVDLRWPAPVARASAAPAIGVAPAPPGSCAALGYDASRSDSGLGPRLTGYRPIGAAEPFPAGVVEIGSERLGVIRIAEFDPHAAPVTCRAALERLGRRPDQPCDDDCADVVLGAAYDRFTSAFEAQLRALKAAGATVLLVDLAGNGGGSEWAEAAARIVTPKRLTSERLGFVRGAHWAAQWQALAERLRQAAADDTSGRDRPRLLAWTKEAETALAAAQRPCAAGQSCPVLARAGYATGLVGSAAPGAFGDSGWAPYVFSIAQYDYHEGVWSGPLAVLVDDETWSAAEEFAAVLQDNRAAVIVGARTGGAGCGHTAGGTPTVLKNSGATLEMPDCVRFRADGSNEVSGIIPDVLVGLRHSDGAAFKARLLAAALPIVADRARSLEAAPRAVLS